MEKINKTNNSLKLDKRFSEEMKIIEGIRPTHKRIKSPNPSNIIPVHRYKPQIDPRTKKDKSFQEFYSLIEQKNKKNVKKFLGKKEKILKNQDKKREEKFKQLMKGWEKIDKKAEKKKLKNYERMQEKHKKLLEYLRNRQKALEKKNKGILDKKSFLKMNPNYQKYENERKEIEEQIKEERRAFDWELIKEREEKITKDVEEKHEEREKKKKEFKKEMIEEFESMNRRLFKNKQALSRVKSLDLKFKSKFTEHIVKAKKQKIYGEKVRRKYKPSMSQDYQELTVKNKNKAHFGLNLMQKRRKMGLQNIIDAKKFLPHSRNVGRMSLERRKKLSSSMKGLKGVRFKDSGRKSMKNLTHLFRQSEDSTMATQNGTLAQSLVLSQKERYNLGRSYLFDLREINKKNLMESSVRDEEPEENSQKIIEYKIKNKTVRKGEKFTREKIKKIEAEIRYLEHMSQRTDLKVRYGHDEGLEALRKEEEADNLLIKSMLAKCVLNDCKVEGKVIKEFRVPNKKYPKPKSPIDYKKARFRLVKKKKKGGSNNTRNRGGRVQDKPGNQDVDDNQGNDGLNGVREGENKPDNNDGYGNDKGVNTEENEMLNDNDDAEEVKEEDLFDKDPLEGNY